MAGSRPANTPIPYFPTLFMIALGFTFVWPVRASQTTPAVSLRVRTDNPILSVLVQRGAARSATFRNLLARIDRTDGIVWIDEGQCGHSVRACLVPTVKLAGPSRLLRVLINTKGDERDVIAGIGHELQHAVEVLSERSIRSSAALQNFFDRVGPTGSGRFETEAAVHAGLDVWTDLGRGE